MLSSCSALTCPQGGLTRLSLWGSVEHALGGHMWSHAQVGGAAVGAGQQPGLAPQPGHPSCVTAAAARLAQPQLQLEGAASHTNPSFAGPVPSAHMWGGCQLVSKENTQHCRKHKYHSASWSRAALLQPRRVPGQTSLIRVQRHGMRPCSFWCSLDMSRPTGVLGACHSTGARSWRGQPGCRPQTPPLSLPLPVPRGRPAGAVPP